MHNFSVWLKTGSNSVDNNRFWSLFPEKEPLFVELYDLQNDRLETVNIASKEPELLKNMMVTFNGGWQSSLKGYKN